MPPRLGVTCFAVFDCGAADADEAIAPTSTSAATAVSAIREPAGPRRKALIVLSDGVDTGSKVSLARAIESAQRADTLVYAILFADEQDYGRGGMGGGPRMGRRGPYGGGGGGRRYPQSRPDGKKILEQMAKETGGAFFEVSKKQPIEQIYERIQEELRSQYNLGYKPERPDAGSAFRKIRVTAKPKGLVVHARDGYYADR